MTEQARRWIGGAFTAVTLGWLVLVLLAIGAPVALPFGLVGGLLALSLFAAMYNLGRGLQRTR